MPAVLNIPRLSIPRLSRSTRVATLWVSIVFLAATGAHAEPYRLEFSATIERVFNAQQVGVPGVLDPGLITRGVIEFDDADPSSRLPDLVLAGRSWNRAIKTIRLGAPLNVVFNAGLVYQSDGVLVMQHDPLGNRDCMLKSMMSSDGAPLRASQTGGFEPNAFILMQAGHPDLTPPLREIIRQAPSADAPRLLVRYRQRPGKGLPGAGSSPQSSTKRSVLSLVFSVGNLRMLEHPLELAAN